MDRQMDRLTDRQAGMDRQTNGQTDRLTGRQIDGWADRQMG